jgi:hypothetical protein
MKKPTTLMDLILIATRIAFNKFTRFDVAASANHCQAFSILPHARVRFTLRDRLNTIAAVHHFSKNHQITIIISISINRFSSSTPVGTNE